MSIQNEVDEMNSARRLTRKALKENKNQIRALQTRGRELSKILQRNSIPAICDKFNLNVKDVIEADNENNN